MIRISWIKVITETNRWVDDERKDINCKLYCCSCIKENITLENVFICLCICLSNLSKLYPNNFLSVNIYYHIYYNINNTNIITTTVHSIAVNINKNTHTYIVTFIHIYIHELCTYIYISPTLKKRCLDHNDLRNYRPVCNLCFIAKILRKLVLSHVSSYHNSHNENENEKMKMCEF